MACPRLQRCQSYLAYSLAPVVGVLTGCIERVAATPQGCSKDNEMI